MFSVKKNFLLGFYFCLSVVLSSCSDDSTKAFDLAVTDFENKKVTLNDFNKDYTVLVFFSKSCSYCTKLLPEIERVSKKYSSQLHVVFIGIDKNLKESNVSKYSKIYNSTVLKDVSSITKYRYSVMGTPALFLIKDGDIIGTQSGYSNSLDSFLHPITFK